MVGALILSRAVDDSKLAYELLFETRLWIDDRSSLEAKQAGSDRPATVS